jgi:hypothetical protein
MNDDTIKTQVLFGTTMKEKSLNPLLEKEIAGPLHS